MLNSIQLYIVIGCIVLFLAFAVDRFILKSELKMTRANVEALKSSIQTQNTAVQRMKAEAASQAVMLRNAEKKAKLVELASKSMANQIMQANAGTSCQDAIEFGIDEASKIKYEK